MTDDEEEQIEAQAMDLERSLTFYQVLFLLSLGSGCMTHTECSEPEDQPSQLLELQSVGLIVKVRAHADEEGMKIFELTTKGRVMAAWYGKVLLETLGVSALFL